MSKAEENEAIKAHHLPIRIVELEAQVESLTKALEVHRETLRDHLAMSALTGLLSGTQPSGTFAEIAYSLADAMMEARQK